MNATYLFERRRIAVALGMAVVLCCYVFLQLPIVAIVASSFSTSQTIEFPPQGFTLRWYEELLNRQELVAAFFLSIRLAVVSTIAATVLGLMAAFAGHGLRRRSAGYFQITMTLPLLVPELLTATALLFFLFQMGLGRSYLGLQLAHVLIAFPFAYTPISGAFRQIPAALEEASASLGAGRWATFRHIVLPMISSGVAFGAVLAFITSFDAYTISLMLKPIGGSTLPVALFDFLTYQFQPTASAAATVSILLAIVAIILIQKLVGIQRAF